MRHTWLFPFLLLCGFSTASAQKPSAEMAKLSILLGKWESHETSESPDGKKTPFVLQGRNTWAHEGRYLQISEHFEIAGAGKFENLILMGFDPSAKLYRAWWYTNNIATPLVFEGDFDGKRLTLTGIQEKKRPLLRINYDFLEEGHYKATLEIRRDDKWTIATTAEYRRISK